ncbi:hypothetical protein E3N88_16554 [Mikania micrantha]|uniref:Uncharacterized protein n=1 Tax=Mikania micrantha TaxID=192012 RepID=A0A5N6NYQ7_9ASTR|nr:hypothetical protein E3N88_16554 [Mikania micrantha]
MAKIVKNLRKYLVESIKTSIRDDLLKASTVQSSAVDCFVVTDDLLLAIESNLAAQVDGLASWTRRVTSIACALGIKPCLDKEDSPSRAILQLISSE